MNTRLKDPHPEFLPKWSKALRDAFKRASGGIASLNYIHSKHKLDYGSFNSCLVGEADLFKEAFNLVGGCDYCHFKFGHAISGFNINDSLKNFYKYKKQFANHLVKKHKGAAGHWGLLKRNK